MFLRKHGGSRRGIRGVANEAVEINVQLTPSFLCASRAVVLLIAYGRRNVTICIVLGFSQEKRRRCHDLNQAISMR
jgi:hypothetical protein